MERLQRPKVREYVRILRCGLWYFTVVFAAGFILGPIRVLWLVPRVGERTAELLEAPIMLLVMVVAARWIVGRFAAPPGTPARLAVGVIALTLLLTAELTVVLWLRGLSIAQYAAERDSVAGLVYVVMLGLFAVMPLLVRRH